jgi:hypothetical protein
LTTPKTICSCSNFSFEFDSAQSLVRVYCVRYHSYLESPICCHLLEVPYFLLRLKDQFNIIFGDYKFLL